MGIDVSGQGAGSQPVISTMVELQKTTVEKEETRTGSGSADAESGKADWGKPMGTDNSGGSEGPKRVDDRVARRRQDPLGRRLRQMYDQVVSEDVPGDFLSFLEKADDRLTGNEGDGGSGSDDPDKPRKP